MGNVQNISIPHLSVPVLNNYISLDEIVFSLKKCKDAKAAGCDNINYSFFKRLPENWLLFLEFLFNKILEGEKIPKEWGKLSIIMLYKSGIHLDVHNYRPITLINCIAKIFSQILSNRLTTWVEDNKITPEFQSGFRRERGCLDNLFSLLSVIQIHLRHPHTAVFAAFIDLKSAFSSVNHEILWKKLQKVGVSDKFINIVKNFYENVYACIKCGNEQTDFVKVSQGVL